MADVVEGSEEDELELDFDPETGLGAGWGVVDVGEDDDEHLSTLQASADWSVSSLDEQEPGSGTLQTSSKSLRKTINASQDQERMGAEEIAGVKSMLSPSWHVMHVLHVPAPQVQRFTTAQSLLGHVLHQSAQL